MTHTQKRAVTALLFKTGDRDDLGNWRPISLLCTDYKMIAKVITNRMQRVSGDVLNEDQTCGVPGRTISSNLMLTRDIISYTNQKDMKGYIITIDQEKAFDRVDMNITYSSQAIHDIIS